MILDCNTNHLNHEFIHSMILTYFHNERFLNTHIIYIHTHTYIYMYMCVCVCVYIYIYIYVCVCVYMYMYVCVCVRNILLYEIYI